MVRVTLIGFTLVAVSALIFVFTEALPGDAASVLLGQQAASEGVLEQLQRDMGLDRNPFYRYFNWIGNAVLGDLGDSPRSGIPIIEMIGSALPHSVILAVAAFIFAIPSSVALGIYLGLRPDSFLDRVLSVFTIFTISLPEFVVGVVLMLILATKLSWLPSSSIMMEGESVWSRPQVLIMPIMTVTGALFAYTLRMARSNVIEVMSSNYVRTAILKGIPMRRVVIRHVVPNALLPTITVIANLMGWLFGGLLIVESVFAYPGIARLLIVAINTRDIRLLQSCALVIGAVIAFSNLTADLIYAFLDPRIRYR